MLHILLHIWRRFLSFPLWRSQLRSSRVVPKAPGNLLLRWWEQEQQQDASMQMRPRVLEWLPKLPFLSLFLFKTLIKGLVSCMSNLLKLGENMYSFRAFVQSACILQSWSQQVDLVLQPQFGRHQWGVKCREWNEHPQGQQMARQLFCYPAPAASPSHSLDSFIELCSYYSCFRLILPRLIQQRDVSLFQWKSKTFPMNGFSAHPVRDWASGAAWEFPHGWLRHSHILILSFRFLLWPSGTCFEAQGGVNTVCLLPSYCQNCC